MVSEILTPSSSNSVNGACEGDKVVQKGDRPLRVRLNVTDRR